MSTHTKLHLERAVIVVAALLLAASPLCAQLGLGLSPMRLELRYPGPASQSGSLTLTNGSAERSRVRAEILDFYLDGQETPQFARNYAQESEFSCRQWLSVNPMEFEVAPGASTVVRYTLRVPQGASERSFHCAAGFTTLPALENMNGTALKTAVRVVAAFYAIVGQPQVDGGMKDVKLERIPAKAGDKSGETAGWRAVILMDNPTVMHYRPTGQLEVLDANGKVIEKHDLNTIPVLPKREQRFLIPLESPMDGRIYTLRARVDIGTHEIQEATVQVAPRDVPASTQRVQSNPAAPIPAAAAGPKE